MSHHGTAIEHPTTVGLVLFTSGAHAAPENAVGMAKKQADPRREGQQAPGQLHRGMARRERPEYIGAELASDRVQPAGSTPVAPAPAVQDHGHQDALEGARNTTPRKATTPS